MGSYYNRRAIFNMQLPGHGRLYPQQRDDSEFETGLGDLPSRQSEAAARNGVAAPPPAYRGAGLPLSRTVSSGATLVTGGSSARRSRVVKLQWAWHPAISGPHMWRDRLFRFLSKKPEKLAAEFPEEFEELLQIGSVDQDSDKVKELWQARVDHLNNWVISDRLVMTRMWFALLEIIDVAIVVLFVIALGVTKGKQEGLLEGAEVALILVILVSAGFVNQIRIRRWSLQHTLRNLSRDWSPLPTTSSTATDLVQAYIGNPVENDDAERGAAGLRAAQQEDGLKPVMRWSMYTREGGFWTSWRPVINVELIVPGSSVPTSTQPAPPLAPVEDWVPTYSERQVAGERVVQFSA